VVSHGFAHGVAGVGSFLLSAALATGRRDYREAAYRAGQTLARAVDREDDGAWWPDDTPGESDMRRWPHWCNGSSGIGTFLVRLWSATGEQRFRDLAHAAAIAVRRDRWHSPVAACHGLAGDGDFLLDLADLTGDRRYHDWAGELAAVMYARHGIRHGRVVLPDESGVAVTAGYGVGLSGALGFLLRLRHGGPRFWMNDEHLSGGPPTSAAGAGTGRHPEAVRP
jgi:rhamnogalacturonyl hydrolase YesR